MAEQQFSSNASLLSLIVSIRNVNKSCYPSRCFLAKTSRKQASHSTAARHDLSSSSSREKRVLQSDRRVTQLECELSLLAEQLQAATAKLAASNAGASDKMSALRSERSVVDEPYRVARARQIVRSIKKYQAHHSVSYSDKSLGRRYKPKPSICT